MPSQAKVDDVERLRARLSGVKTAVLTQYRGLTVQQLSDLRRQLKPAAAEYKVLKNRLARLAIQGPDKTNDGSVQRTHQLPEQYPAGRQLSHRTEFGGLKEPPVYIAQRDLEQGIGLDEGLEDLGQGHGILL